MPIYEYICRACGKQTEKLQKLSEPDFVDCPHCAQSALQRTVSAAGFRLAGSGWYETDFKKDGKRNLSGEASSAGGDSNGASSTASASSESSDKGSKTSKSESKAESKSKPGAKRSETTPSK